MTADFNSWFLFLYLKSVKPDSLPEFSVGLLFALFCSLLFRQATMPVAETQNDNGNEISEDLSVVVKSRARHEQKIVQHYE